MLKRQLRQIYEFQGRETELAAENGRRASVAVILRIRGYSQPDLASYLAHVPDGAVAEILFIKRAVSKRDRWSGHIALPGGRREDGETDLEAAVRETIEEVGIDLASDGFFLGPLDQRLLRVSWGRRVAMALCPFVFILNEPEVPVLPQISEVAASFWYPVDKLVDPAYKSSVEVNIGDRLGTHWMPWVLERLVTINLGDISFNAINLYPDERDMVCHDDVPPPPFKLWGVTLGVMHDVLEVFDPGFFERRISLIDFKAVDMRCVLWLFNGLRSRAQVARIAAELKSGLIPGNMDLVSRALRGRFKYFPTTVFVAIILRYLAALFVLRKLIRARSR